MSTDLREPGSPDESGGAARPAPEVRLEAPRRPSPGPTDPGARSVRPHRGRRLAVRTLAILGALAVVVGAIVAITGALGRDEPSTAVLQYYLHLESGDAVGALAYGSVPAGSTAYLTDAVLAEQNSVAQLHDVSVLASDTVDASHSTVVVQYHLRFVTGDEVVTDRVPAVHANGRWQLARSAVSTVVQLGQGAARATLAGTSIPANAVLLLPGALPLRFDTPLLELSASDGAVEFDSTGTTEALSQVTSAAKTTFGATLDAALTACLQNAESASLNCPEPVVPSGQRAVPNSARGIVKQPASSLVSYIVASTPSGFVTGEVTVSVTGSYQSLDFDNVLETHAGTYQLQFQAEFDPLHPDRVTWP